MLTRKAKANQNQGWRGSAACSPESSRKLLILREAT
jgi:hypothetical protein